MGVGHENRASLYAEVTGRVIAELEQGRLPWVQPWDAAACGCAMPANAVTGRRYSGINVLILWAAVIDGRYASQRWLTFRQAQAAGNAHQHLVLGRVYLTVGGHGGNLNLQEHLQKGRLTAGRA